MTRLGDRLAQPTALVGVGQLILGLIWLAWSLIPPSEVTRREFDAWPAAVLCLTGLLLVLLDGSSALLVNAGLVEVAAAVVFVVATRGSPQGQVTGSVIMLGLAVVAAQLLPWRVFLVHLVGYSLALTAAFVLNPVYVNGFYPVVLITQMLFASIAVARLVHQRQALLEIARDQSMRDPLTGVLNRRGSELRAEEAHAIAGREGTLTSVILIDLDSFKAYNDEHGHLAGDRLLRDLSSSWQGVLRSSDILARLGGDEFMVVCPGTDRAAATTLVQRMRESYPAPWSYGLSSWGPREPLDQALRRADRAMYAEKGDHGRRPERRGVADSGP